MPAATSASSNRDIGRKIIAQNRKARHDYSIMDVFEAGVHALAVEGDHGVGGVAEDDGAGLVMVGGAFYGYEG